MPPRRTRWLWLAVLGSLTHAGFARAAQPTPLRVVVRVAGEADRRILSRVRGQLSDVPVSVQAKNEPALEPSFAAQLRRASELASDNRTVVVWFRFERAAKRQLLLVHIATPHLERVFTRRLDATGNGAGLDSGLLESTALVVRGAIKALAEGGSIGVTREQAVKRAQGARDAGTTLAAPEPPAIGPDEAPSVATDTPSSTEAEPPETTSGDTETDTETETKAQAEAHREATPDPRKAEATPDPRKAEATPDSHETETQGDQDASPASAEPEPTADALPAATDAVRPKSPSEPSPPVSFHGYLGWQGVLDGETTTGHHGTHVQIGASWRGWLLAASGTASLPATIDGSLAALRVGRHAAGALIGWQPHSQGSLRGLLALRAGAVFFRRRTEAKVETLEPAAPSTLVSFAFGPEARVMWMPSSVGIGLMVGLDVLPRPPRFEVSGDGAGSMQGVSLWKLQPRIGLGLEVHLS